MEKKVCTEPACVELSSLPAETVIPKRNDPSDAKHPASEVKSESPAHPNSMPTSQLVQSSVGGHEARKRDAKSHTVSSRPGLEDSKERAEHVAALSKEHEAKFHVGSKRGR